MTAIQTFALADVTKLSAGDRKVLEDSARFHEVHAVTNLPPAVIAICADTAGRLAEPGQKWEATDHITDSSLPRKRLIWAAVAGQYHVVHYERGGLGLSRHILVAILSDGEPKLKVVWHGVEGPLKNYSAFLDALRSGKLDDRLDYAH